MRLKYRLFPYPVLSFMTDDYIDSIFESEVSVSHDPNTITFFVSIKFENEEILELIDCGAAEFICHVECAQTSYRVVRKSRVPEMKIIMEESKINGAVNICTFVVANSNIHNYRNKMFNPDYSDRSFSIEKCGILAYANQTNVYIDKETEELSKIPSIFAILKKQSEDIEPVDINLDSDKIIIRLCDNEYYSYQKVVRRYDLQQASHAMLIFPALVYTIEKVKLDGCDHYIEFRWFRAIKKRLQDFNIELNDMNLKNEDSFLLAQRLLNMPVNRAFTAVAGYNVEEEGEE